MGTLNDLTIENEKLSKVLATTMFQPMSAN